MKQEDQACKNPIEDQRKQALEHYNELATKCCHWNSFVENAIKAYNPESPEHPAEQGVDYWKQRCEAAEDLLAVMNVPKNKADGHNDSFLLFGERNQKWQKSKYKKSQPEGSEPTAGEQDELWNDVYFMIDDWGSKSGAVLKEKLMSKYLLIKKSK